MPKPLRTRPAFALFLGSGFGDGFDALPSEHSIGFSSGDCVHIVVYGAHGEEMAGIADHPGSVAYFLDRILLLIDRGKLRRAVSCDPQAAEDLMRLEVEVIDDNVRLTVKYPEQPTSHPTNTVAVGRSGSIMRPTSDVLAFLRHVSATIKWFMQAHPDFDRDDDYGPGTGVEDPHFFDEDDKSLGHSDTDTTFRK